MADAAWIKDPDATLDWSWDWSQWLASGEAITARTVSVTQLRGAGTTPLAVASSSNTSTAVTAWLTAGAADAYYRVTCRISTNQGRTDDRSVWITCAQR